MNDDIASLVLTERVEVIVPVTYLIMMVMAFYGPNAEIMGNVKLRIWHHQSPIEDINVFLVNLGLLIVVDVFGFVTSGLLLWKYCQVNVIKVLQKIQKKFWYLLLVTEGYLLIEVSLTVIVVQIKPCIKHQLLIYPGFNANMHWKWP